MVHPDHPNKSGMIERYGNVITKDGGTVHRLEDWEPSVGLPHQQNPQGTLRADERRGFQRGDGRLTTTFRYNDAVIATWFIEMSRLRNL